MRVVLFMSLVMSLCSGLSPLTPAGYAALSLGLVEISKMKQAMAGGSAIPKLGSVADGICERALETIGPYSERMYVLSVLEGQLKVCYERQLRILRDIAVRDFQRGGSSGTTLKKGSGCAEEHLRLAKVERAFCVACVEASRENWSFEHARRELRESLFAVSSRSAEVRSATLKAAQQRANYFTVLRKLVLELEDATNQRLGIDAPVDAAFAWRVPDTNINLSAALQRYKTNVQLSVVPDDSAPLLTPTGFNKPKVGPGDLALTYKADFLTEK